MLETWKNFTRRQVLARLFKEKREIREAKDVFMYWNGVVGAIRQVKRTRQLSELNLVFGSWRAFVFKKKVSDEKLNFEGIKNERTCGA